MAGHSTTGSSTAAVAVVLLQPTKWGGKARTAGDTITLPAPAADSLVAAGSAQFEGPAAQAAAPESAAEPAPAKASKRATPRTPSA